MFQKALIIISDFTYMSQAGNFDPQVFQVTFAANGSVSNVVALNGYVVQTLLLPGTIAGTGVTFNTGDSQGTTLYPVYGTAGTITTVAMGNSRAIPLPFELSSLKSIQFVTSGTQTADRVAFLQVK